MGFMSGTASLAANTTTANLCAGKPHEFALRPSIARIAIVGSATGLRATIVVGNRNVVQDEGIAESNRFPIDPDDYLFTFALIPGERLSIYIRNTTGGALTYWFVAKVDAVA